MTQPTLTAICKELGISQPTGSRYKARGMPLHSVNAAREWYESNVNARIKDSRAPPADDPIDTGVPDYQESRARREAAEAAKAEFAVLQLKGELLEAKHVGPAILKQIAAALDALQSMASRLAPILAAESDVAKTTTILDTAVRSAISSIEWAQ